MNILCTRNSYSEVCKVKTDDVLLIIDNCGGHETNITLSRLRIELLHKQSTSKYQTLDHRLMAHAKCGTALRCYVMLLTLICGGIPERITFHYRRTLGGSAFMLVICLM